MDDLDVGTGIGFRHLNATVDNGTAPNAGHIVRGLCGRGDENKLLMHTRIVAL